MRKIFMGLYISPVWVYAEEIIQKWEAEGIPHMVDYWNERLEGSLELREEIIKAIEEDGECELSWSCDSTWHHYSAVQWREAMPEYEFEIGYDCQCIVRKRK